jgi:hypothetical protein
MDQTLPPRVAELLRTNHHRLAMKFARPPRFIIVSTGRAGSKYVANLLSELGVACGHERVYTPLGPRYKFLVRGDSSWLAVPYLAEYQGIVLHQVRNPLSVIASLLSIGFFSRDINRFTDFSRRYFTPTGDELVDCMNWYTEWNSRCEKYATIRYKIEDIQNELPKIFLALGKPVPDAFIEAVNKLPTNINSLEARPKTMKWESLPDGKSKQKLSDMAIRYGYHSVSALNNAKEGSQKLRVRSLQTSL